MPHDETLHTLQERIEQLERENMMLKAAIKASPAGILVATVPDGVIEYWNDAALGIRGDSATNLTHIPMDQHPSQWQTFHPNGDMYDAKDLPLSRAIASGEVVHGEDVIIRDSDGNERWVSGHAAPVYDDDGTHIAGVAVFPDITERKTAELDAQRLRRMVMASPDFIGMALPNGDALFTNPAGLALCGIEPNRVGLTIANFHPHDVAQRILTVGIPAAIEHGFWSDESELLHVDGTRIPVSQVLMAHKGTKGEVTHYSTVMRDLRPLRDLESQLRQSQRLESVGRLAGGIAHDFNNLLTVINNYAALVCETLDESDPRHDDLVQVGIAADRAAQLCAQLLSFARQQIIKPCHIDLRSVVADLSKLFDRTLGEDVLLTTHIQHDLWPIKVDRSQLDQVLLNLVVNARDAMPEGGELTIEASNVTLDVHYAASHPDVEPGDYVQLSVSDTGEGMTPEVRERVFEPFFTTKSALEGTGLGLATVHGAVRQNHGHIWIYTEAGRGTCFKIFWPRSSERANDVPERAPRRPGRGSGTILVVEDEPSIRHLAVRLLQDAGYRVLTAQHGPEALAYVEALDQPVDLLLTDVIMPHMTGSALAEQLAERVPTLKVLYVSGYTENTIVHRGVLEEGVQFLAKPFTRDSLLRAVDAILRPGSSPVL